MVAPGAALAALTDDAIAAAMERAITRLRTDRSRPQCLTLMPNAPDHVLAHVGADGWVEIGVGVASDLGVKIRQASPDRYAKPRSRPSVGSGQRPQRRVSQES